MPPTRNKTVLTIISATLKEAKDQYASQLSFDDPILVNIQTITPENIHDSGIIKSTYNKEKIKKLVLEYIAARMNNITQAKPATRQRQKSDLFDELTRAAGQPGQVNPDQNDPKDSQERSNDESEREKETESEEKVKERKTEQAPLDPSSGAGEGEDDILDDEEHGQEAGATEFSRKFPNLPATYCPNNLFISTLRPKYIDSLYTTDREAYPKNWTRMRKTDPDQAWNSLNQTMINFLNRRWSAQGIHVKPGETIVDFYSYNDLKAAIVQTISSIKLDQQPVTKEVRHMAAGEEGKDVILTGRLEKSVIRLEEATRIITSNAVKITGREIADPAQSTTIMPRLSGTTLSRLTPRRAPSPLSEESEGELFAG